MRRKLFSNRFKIRIPRKLKKAAKYGVIINRHNWHSWDYPAGYQGEEEYVIIGRNNKWKEKVLRILYREKGFYYVETWY